MSWASKPSRAHTSPAQITVDVLQCSGEAKWWRSVRSFTGGIRSSCAAVSTKTRHGHRHVAIDCIYALPIDFSLESPPPNDVVS